MRLSVLASGSGGNCLLLSGRQTNLLIDAGISTRRIQSFLFSRGLAWRDIGGVLITHEHSDHIYGLQTMARCTDVAVYAPHTVANRLLGLLPSLQERLRIIPVGEPFSLGEFRVTAFHTPHDTDESVGYRVEGSGVFALATDMGCVTEEIRRGLTGADAVLIEANHDVQMLRDGPYPIPLKRRILSPHGHLSNADCALLARQLAAGGTKKLILGHLSRENNRPELALAAVGAALEGLGAELFCAPPLGPLELEICGEEPC
ncbi:MAG: MBL fold metallo-hydrolase [Oscillospiraceae bacterium]|nr:MBL fold metallo-hydrolase [Oscillospiraceae bacterium]